MEETASEESLLRMDMREVLGIRCEERARARASVQDRGSAREREEGGGGRE